MQFLSNALQWIDDFEEHFFKTPRQCHLLMPFFQIACEAQSCLREDSQPVYHLVQNAHYLLASKILFSFLLQDANFQVGVSTQNQILTVLLILVQSA